MKNHTISQEKIEALNYHFFSKRNDGICAAYFSENILLQTLIFVSVMI